MVLSLGWSILIVSIIGFVIITPLIIFFIVLLNKYKSTRDIPRDNFLIMYGMKKFTNGHAHGFIKNIIEHNSGRKIVEFYPTDPTDQELKDMKEIPLEVVITDKLHTIPKGKHTKGYNTNIIFSKNTLEMQGEIENMPETLKDGFSKTSILDSVKNKVFTGMIEGDNAQTEIIKMLNKGGLTRELLIQIQEFSEEYIKKIMEDKGEKKGD